MTDIQKNIKNKLLIFYYMQIINAKKGVEKNSLSKHIGKYGVLGYKKLYLPYKLQKIFFLTAYPKTKPTIQNMYYSNIDLNLPITVEFMLNTPPKKFLKKIIKYSNRRNLMVYKNHITFDLLKHNVCSIKILDLDLYQNIIDEEKLSILINLKFKNELSSVNYDLEEFQKRFDYIKSKYKFALCNSVYTLMVSIYNDIVIKQKNKINDRNKQNILRRYI